MSFATYRPYVRLPRSIPPEIPPNVAATIQQLLDAAHELNARVYFLQEQLDTLAAATATTIDTLEDY